MSTATRIESEAEELERHLVAYDTACDKYDMLARSLLPRIDESQPCQLSKIRSTQRPDYFRCRS